MARMDFSLLPTELQIQIFSYLGNSDLKSARAVCRKFRDNASVSLFRTIVACAGYQVMGAFQNISLNSVYAGYVKEIVWDASVFDHTLASNETVYQQRADDFEDLRNVVSWARRSRFKRYRQLYREQEDLKNGLVLLRTVARALEWMPNVISVIYSPGPHQIPVEVKDMRGIIPRGVASSYHPGRDDNVENGFHHFIGGIWEAKYTGIREFRVSPASTLNQRPEFSLTCFEFEQPGYLEAGKFFFRHLYRLQLEMSLYVRLGTPRLNCLRNMADLLAEAKDLRDLSFHLSRWQPDPRAMYGHIMQPGQRIFQHLGLGLRWPNLRSLDIGGMHADEEELKGMICRHKGTLATLKFVLCSLLSGKWSNIVDEVVYNTNIMPFVLDRVNEFTIGDDVFFRMPRDKSEQWQYEGQVEINEKGDRYFTEAQHKKSLYAWRHLDE